MCIEHGPFLSEKTMKLMAEKGFFLIHAKRISKRNIAFAGISASSLGWFVRIERSGRDRRMLFKRIKMFDQLN